MTQVFIVVTNLIHLMENLMLKGIYKKQLKDFSIPTYSTILFDDLPNTPVVRARIRMVTGSISTTEKCLGNETKWF